MYTEICAELGVAIATANGAPGIHFNLILSLLQLPCSAEPQRGVNKCASLPTRRGTWTWVREGRKRVIGIMAAILASLDMETADDLFGNPAGKSENGQADRGEYSVGEEDHGED
jgi:hypothetical protein